MKKRRLLPLLLLLGICFHLPVLAQKKDSMSTGEDWTIKGSVLLFCDSVHVVDSFGAHYERANKATLVLYQKGVLMHISRTDSNGIFHIHNIDSGVYELIVSEMGHPITRRFKLDVWTDGAVINLVMICGHSNYRTGPTAYCPEGHIDDLLRINYEASSKKFDKRIEKGKARLQKGVGEACPPRYYCKEHGWLFH